MKTNYIKIIYRFISIHFLSAFSIVFTAISCIISLFSFLDRGRIYSKHEINVSGSIMMQLALQDILNAINLVLPLSILIASIITFHKLSKSSELIVIRSVGISIFKIIRPIIFICISIGILNMTILSPLSTMYGRYIDKLKYKEKITTNNPFSFTKNGLWIKERSKDKQSFINVEYIQKIDNELHGNNIIIFTSNLNNIFQKKIHAETGILKSNILILNNVKSINSRLQVNKAKIYEYSTNLTIDKIENASNLPTEFSFWQLPSFISFFEKAGFSVRKYKSYYYTLLFLPLSLIAMLFIGLIFSISTKRNQIYVIIRLFSGIITGFSVFFLDQVIHAFGVSGRFPILFSVISIPTIAILICINILLHLEEG